MACPSLTQCWATKKEECPLKTSIALSMQPVEASATTTSSRRHNILPLEGIRRQMMTTAKREVDGSRSSGNLTAASRTCLRRQEKQLAPSRIKLHKQPSGKR